jgi:single-strand DNA-binding protein
MSVNKVILVGNLGREPELRATPSGQSVCNFSLATTERFTGRDGQAREQTEWHNIVVWGKPAEACGRYLKKGSQAYIEGRITNREYEARDGTGKRYRTEVVAHACNSLAGALPPALTRARQISMLVPIYRHWRRRTIFPSSSLSIYHPIGISGCSNHASVSMS